MIRLSKRLTAITELVTKGNIVCDVGTDHAHVPIRLLQEGTVDHAIAMDVRKGPLDIAKENLELTGLEDKVELRLSDGLASYKDKEAQTLIIAGMGGLLMRRILEEGEDKVFGFKELILEPQSEYWAVRDFLMKNGIGIVYEEAVFEDGKTYPVIKAVPGEKSILPPWDRWMQEVAEMTEDVIAEAKVNRGSVLALLQEENFRYQAETEYGPCLLAQKDAVIKRYITVMLRKRIAAMEGLANADSNNADAARRIVSISGEIGLMQVLLFLFEFVD